MNVNTRRMSRRATFLVAAACNCAALAQSHPTGVPVLSSKPGAAYTVYLDFAGFDFTGTWGSGGPTPGDGGAYEGATTSFTASQQSDIDQVWAHVAEKYSAFNVNVTTLDPAIAAGDAGSDFARQAYYDATAKMMHTVIGSEDGWNDAGGESFVGVTKNAESTSGNGGASYGYHTNWTFTNGVGTSPQIVGEDASHENGHGFGLEHQSDWNGTTKTEEYSSNSSSEGNGSFAPTMGDSYYSQRGLWRQGLDDQGTGTTMQNDVQVIEGNTGMGAYTNDGIGHTMASASLLPIGGATVNDQFARGIIVPASTGSPNPNGSANYTSDYYAFNSTGGSVTLTAYNGAERVAFGSVDSGITLKSILTIYNSSGGSVATATTNSATQTDTITQTLPAGLYYAQIASSGDTNATITGNTSYYYDMGSFFLTGSGLSGGLATNLYFAGGASTTRWNQIDSATTTNWRTTASGTTDPVQTPSTDVNVFLSANSSTGLSSTTLGTSTTINSLTFTGTGTSAASTSVALAADGSTLTIIALASNTSYRATGLTVLSGALADTIATPVVLGSSQIWAVNNLASNPLLVSGIIGDGGSGFGITKSGTGSLTLSAANTFSGESAMSGGSILLENALALQDTTLNNSGGTLAFDSSVSPHAFMLGGIGGSSGLVLADNAGTPDSVALTAGSDGDSTTLSGIVSGGGSLTKVGGGALTLSGANTFTGTRTISDGTINLSGNQNASTGSILLTGDSSNDAETLNILSGGTAVAAGNSIQIGNASSLHSTAIVNSSGGMINSGSLTIARAGSLTLNSGAAWNQSGAMTIEGIGGYSAGVVVGSGASFSYNGSSAISLTDGSSGATAVINISGGTFTTSKNFNLALHGTGSDTVDLGGGGTLAASVNITDLFTTSVSATPIVFIVDVGNGTINTGANAVGITDTVTGTGLLNKSGTGLLTLSGNNTYSGGTNISAGTILATSNTSLGTGTIDILTGGTSTASLQLSGGVTITNTFAGFASETGGNTPTIESVSGNDLVTSQLSITSTGGNGAIFQADAGSTLNLSGGLTTTLTSSRLYYLQGTGNGFVPGNITDSGSNILGLVKTGTGAWTLTGNNNYAAGTTVSTGTLIFASPGAMPAFTNLSITGIAIAANHGTAAKNSLFASNLTLAGSPNNSTGKLDLTNNDLVVRNGSLTTLNAEVRQGYNAGGAIWQGSGGIVSSAAAGDSTHLTALGVIQNSVDGSSTGAVLMNSFDGRTVYNDDILVKYTYYGDATLDGKVDGSDYSRIDSGYLEQLTGWYNGDFNYDGVINGSDYTLIDNAFNTQGAILSSIVADPAAAVSSEISENPVENSVPEPFSGCMLGLGLAGLLGRRRGGYR